MSTHSGRPRRVLAALTVVLTATGLAACAVLLPATDVSPSAAARATDAAASVPAGLEDFYSQDVDWYPCVDTGMAEAEGAADFTCAYASVPLDYSDPSGRRIDIAMKRRAATGTAIGSLFINPGGPGGSGVSLVESAEGYFSDALMRSYDVIGFDPRGVGSSTAIDCLTDAELDEERAGSGDQASAGSEASDAAAAQDAVAEYVEWYEGKCAANTPADLLDHVDTVSAARDLDVLRAVIGEDLLTYLGYSYGTYLGATYAELFPSNVGRMVLDGAIDPTLSAGEVTLGQAAGFEKALRAYVEDCLSGNKCPLRGDVDAGVSQIQDFLQVTADAPIPTSDPDRPLTYSLAESAILGIMYQSESWSVLSEGLDQAMNHDDGSVLLRVADLFASRQSDGTYRGNGNEAINAINCLDYPVVGDADSWEAEREQLEAISPTFGADLGYSDLYCSVWGHASSRERAEIHASGAAPILVVGTTGDPATPYAWSQALSEQLEDGHLVTWRGNGHTAYGRADACVADAVDNYLLAGVLPEEGLTCG
ncbi:MULTISPECIES: alpha/beta hydrolase [unclassified Actinomyces]|uniref:alpha/beta hydrolase n=1 Tax=unclassified Actinomyces TaxID=2609248 RepID=UPI001373E626|nr:alpha/beta hydrolase [Actinomyces sp. 432]NDR53160.1 alpha/beta hydrolase [Actinomyces sp. 565]QHO90336.1 alpha/beta hydrolase [Actinomyces sp. 432]